MKIFNKVLAYLTSALIFTLYCSCTSNQKDVKIGNQVWSNVNLSIDTFRNGQRIIESKNKDDWYKAGDKGEPTWCYYMFDENYSHLGKLYNYYAASSPNNIAPNGWKVPTYFDYFELIKHLDPLITHTYFAENGSLAGGSLKIKDSLYWQQRKCQQIDSKFNAIPAGGYSPSVHYPEYDWVDYDGLRVARYWCITDWQQIIEIALVNSPEKNRFLEKLKKGGYDEKAIVFRLSNKDCKVDADDDPKLYGYSLRLVKKDN